KSVLVDKVKNLDDEQINSKVNSDGWTLGQVYYHLFLIEDGTFKSIAKKVKEITTLESGGLKSMYRIYLLKIFLALPLKFRAPRLVSDSIPDTIDIKEVLKNWDEIRDKFSLLLAAQDDRFLKKKVFKHPRVGYIDFYQTIEFIEAHHQHHFRQINNLLSKI
ncbi:DinB family protein, partial [Fulvivirga lutimaris]|uniref:DinB family protein n=1 Tax=Fulvivirga lutimaris TaxID=1819566 RepID=UPI0012BC9A3A